MKNDALEKAVNNIYNALYRREINVKRAEIKELLGDKDTYTEDEKKAVIDTLYSKYTSALTVTTSDEDLELVDENPLDTGEDNFVKEPLMKSESESESPLDLYKPEPKSDIINHQQATDLVVTKSLEMGIEIKTSEVRTIASQITAQNLDAQQAVISIIGMLNGMVERQEQSFNIMFTTNVNEFIENTNQSMNRRITAVNNSLEAIVGDLEASQTAQKSYLSDLLSNVESYISSQGA